MTSICDRYYLVTPEETFQINETTGICWKRLEQGADVSELCAAIESHFDIEDKKVLSLDIHSLVSDLMNRHLIVRNSQ